MLRYLQANILLDDDCRVCIADFGVSRFTDAELVTMGFSTWRPGAIAWMPPEVLLEGKCEYTGDVYSFACVCLEVSVPFSHSYTVLQ